ncbi:MAG: hypothetical protein HN658_07380 [Rhodospirillales bacterium]|nr:hypothetical protein [Rhodospirillales bacterium]MBT4007580.1 hypothetical protein [Rhodospirillales bacterium]MBT5076201.1 hypothetical protein [Rhodospirillales bacterium]MBT5113294.1 hypothetical protein [Rhodospirillales bacterium]MBT5671927.1 hypothetical protein [Rhodospirillales bacterium]
MQFTRASSATYLDSSRIMQTASTNEPRLDHDPVTGESLGLLVENAAANLPTGISDLSNWSVVNATYTLNDALAPNGTTTAEKLVSTGDGNAVIDFTPANTNNHKWSFWLKSATGGNFSITCIVARMGPFGGVVAGLVLYNITTEWQRFEYDYNPLDTTSHRLILGGFNSFLSGEELYFWAPNNVEGSVLTSTILGGTRAADIPTVSDVSWFNDGGDGTFIVEASKMQANDLWSNILVIESASTDRILIQATDPGTSPANATRFGIGESATFGVLVDGDAGYWSAANSQQIGVAWTGAGDDAVLVTDGAVKAADISYIVPTGNTELAIGYDPGTIDREWDGHVARITYYNTRLSNAQIQVLTA